MNKRLWFDILPQPDDATCGPTCLHAVYRYYGDDISLQEVISEVPRVDGGGTLAVLLGCHALRRGYRATIYTYNLKVFDPTWFKSARPSGKCPDLRDRLMRQMEAKHYPKLHIDSNAYLEFLNLGGELRFDDLTPPLLGKYLNKSMPILTGLSATYLYGCARELVHGSDYDDIRGEPTGHFVVLYGYGKGKRSVLVADPLLPNPIAKRQYYMVKIHRLIGAILLGIVTYDANFLIIDRPANKKRSYGKPHRR